jgi:hypothetical protein
MLKAHLASLSTCARNDSSAPTAAKAATSGASAAALAAALAGSGTAGAWWWGGRSLQLVLWSSSFRATRAFTQRAGGGVLAAGRAPAGGAYEAPSPLDDLLFTTSITFRRFSELGSSGLSVQVCLWCRIVYT